MENRIYRVRYFSDGKWNRTGLQPKYGAEKVKKILLQEYKNVEVYIDEYERCEANACKNSR